MSAPDPTEDVRPGPAPRIWDLPLRLFHWLLAIAVAVSFYTGLDGGFEEMDWHQRSGFVVLGLLIFRVLWGLVGTRHARFASFVRGPGPVLEWIRGALRRNPPHADGHNALAGWTILLLLAALITQAVTGLFSSDDLFVEGPLVHRVTAETVSTATGIHGWGKWVVGVLVGLHLLAIAVHRAVFGDRIVAAMFTGRRRDASPDAGIRSQRLLTALVLAAGAAGGVWYLVVKL